MMEITSRRCLVIAFTDIYIYLYTVLYIIIEQYIMYILYLIYTLISILSKKKHCEFLDAVRMVNRKKNTKNNCGDVLGGTTNMTVCVFVFVPAW